MHKPLAEHKHTVEATAWDLVALWSGLTEYRVAYTQSALRVPDPLEHGLCFARPSYATTYDKMLGGIYPVTRLVSRWRSILFSREAATVAA
jgi:hypothetical protein